jgi:hypothetical protein
VLTDLLSALTAHARRQGLNDSQWALAAGLRKETLSRLRARTTCDFATLEGLARAAGARFEVAAAALPATTADGHFPAALHRKEEERLLEFCAMRKVDPALWRSAGPAFFMAGLATMLASADGFDRRRYLALAEALHPGATNPEVFDLWLARSPVRPSRFLPSLAQRTRHAA